MSIDNLESLFEHELRDTLDAERQIVKALPKLIRAAENGELQTALEEHLEITKTQIGRLETIFEMLDKAPRGKHCAGMEGLITEGSDLVKEEDPGAPLDAAMIGAAQKVEHYEIAAYGTLVAHAKILGMEEAVELLEESLAEEKEADETLTEVAASLNLEAQEA